MFHSRYASLSGQALLYGVFFTQIPKKPTKALNNSFSKGERSSCFIAGPSLDLDLIRGKIDRTSNELRDD
jgi:hypothetical protein